MATLKINILNQDALAILKGMELAGLITLPKKETKHSNLSKKLRGSISSSRAQEMIETIERPIQNNGLDRAPIEWAEKQPSIDDFKGIWSDRSIALNDIRTKG